MKPNKPMFLMTKQEAIRQIALDETDPAQAPRFEPVCKGPVFAVVAIVVLGTLGVLDLIVRRVFSVFIKRSV